MGAVPHRASTATHKATYGDATEPLCPLGESLVTHEAPVDRVGLALHPHRALAATHDVPPGTMAGPCLPLRVLPKSAGPLARAPHGVPLDSS